MDYTAQEEDNLLNGNGYDGSDLHFNRASRGNDDDQDLTESQYLVKSIQEVHIR